MSAIDEVIRCSGLIGHFGCGQTEIANFNVVIAIQKNIHWLEKKKKFMDLYYSNN